MQHLLREMLDSSLYKGFFSWLAMAIGGWGQGAVRGWL